MAVDIFAKLGDIKGESTDAKHKDEIEVLSYSWGLSQTGSTAPGAGGGSGKPIFQDLAIVHRIDKASPRLMQACATGARLRDATITHRKAGKGQQEYFIVKMSDVLITAVSHAGDTSEPGSESVTMAFGKVHVTYTPQKADGSPDASVEFTYDLKTNKVG